MSYLKPVAALFALAALPAVAPAADDVAALHAELQAMKNDYSARVDALEARLKQLETANAAAADAAASLAAAPPAPVDNAPAIATPASGGGANAFNPSISV